MTEFEREQLYRQLATSYTDITGADLKAQAENPPDVPDTTLARLDRRVRAAARPNRRRTLRLLGGLAAVVALALALQPMLRSRRDAAYTAEGGAPASSATGGPAAGGGETTADESPAPAETAEDGQILPLGFVLPADYTLADVELDNGLTVYTLKGSLQETLVVTLDPEDNTDQYTHLREIDIEGTTAYITTTAEYSLVALAKNGVGYTLCWQHELSPLIALAHYIV